MTTADARALSMRDLTDGALAMLAEGMTPILVPTGDASVGTPTYDALVAEVYGPLAERAA